MGLHLQLYIKSTPMLIPTTSEIWWVHNHQIQEWSGLNPVSFGFLGHFEVPSGRTADDSSPHKKICGDAPDHIVYFELALVSFSILPLQSNWEIPGSWQDLDKF